MHPIEVERVWKRYRTGARHDSLRDTFAALLKRAVGRNGDIAEPAAFWALQDVSFHVAQGETLGVIGPNGAGKSTILKLLSKITKQTKGSMAVRGRLVGLIELGGGFHPDLTGKENIYLQGTMLGLSRRNVDRHFDSIVAFSELGEFLQTPIKRYSSGMVVRLGFAIAAHVQPEVLLIDEVLAVGDIAFQQKCFQQISQLKQGGTTMIFISHNFEAVQKLCDRVVVLKEGRIITEGDPADIIQRYRKDVLAGTIKNGLTEFQQAFGPVRLTGVVLRDGSGVPVEILNTGDLLRVEVQVEADRPVVNPAFRVAVERLDGLLCHATLSHRSGLGIKELSGRSTVTVEYPRLALLPNVYQVKVELFEGNNPVPLARVAHQNFFQVDSDHHERGAVHLDHNWSFADDQS